MPRAALFRCVVGAFEGFLNVRPTDTRPAVRWHGRWVPRREGDPPGDTSNVRAIKRGALVPCPGAYARRVLRGWLNDPAYKNAVFCHRLDAHAEWAKIDRRTLLALLQEAEDIHAQRMQKANPDDQDQAQAT